MTSFLGKVVCGLIRAMTYTRRKNSGSLSESVHVATKPYRPPKGMRYRRIGDGGAAVEILSPQCPRRALLHFHGGGRKVPLGGFYRKVAELYAKRFDAEVWSIDYRTGTRLVHPSMLDDCMRALETVERLRDLSDFAAIGDSMGANLMLSSLMKRRDMGGSLPRALVALSPFCDLTASGDSYARNVHADPLYGLPYHMSADKYGDRVRRVPLYCGETSPADPSLSPVFGDFSKFPPVSLHVGERETSCDDAYAVADAARRDGAHAEVTEYGGMFHDFMLFVPFLQESKRCFKAIEKFFGDNGV